MKLSHLCLYISTAAAAIPFNGWYHCEMNSINYNMYSHGRSKSHNLPLMDPEEMTTERHSGKAHRGLNSYTNYECGEFQLPMCHEEVCENSSGKTIDVFVKRKLANPQVVELGKEKVIWVLQGGPGDSSTAMEQLMSSLYYEMKEAVSIYTMDHRGTGRSNRLVCVASEAMTSGSPGGMGITNDEYPACFKDLLFQVDNHPEAFSVTSAAYDLKKVIEDTQTSNEVFVYGLSYGTYLVERLMHLESPAIRGYVVDSIVSESARRRSAMASFTNWDKDVARVGVRFLDLCTTDPFCSAKFNHKNVTEFTWALYESLDLAAKTPGTSLCADLMNDLGVGSPSESLRSLFGSMLQSQMYREMIPAIIFRLDRCAAKDVNVMQTFVDKYIRQDGRWSLRSNGEDEMLYYSELLYGLIVYSEMWQIPTPSFDDLYQVFLKGIMGGSTYALVQQYCIFSGARDPACAEFNLLPSPAFVYKPDKYWNITASVPNHSTALLMSGGLDPQTERKYAEVEDSTMEGLHRLIEFPYAGHCTTFTTRTTKAGNTCGVKILASYVVNGGDVNAIDTSCMPDVIGLKFDGIGAGWLQYFGTMDAFDGDTSHYSYVQKAATAEARQREHANMTAGVAILGTIVVVAAMLVVRQSMQMNRLRKKQLANESIAAPVEKLDSSGSIVLDDDCETPGTPPEPIVV